MVLSKVWLVLIAFVAALAASLALLAPRPIQRDLERESGARLERAQHAASLVLKVNARKWMDTAAQVATDAVLVEALEQATRGPADLGLVHKTVQERLRYFNDKMKVDLVIATDGKGRVIARAGLDEGVYKDGVEGFPLVADALRGLRGDDTWSLDGKLYRVAASPVIARDRYAGSLIVGEAVDGALAQLMKQVLDVDVAFLLRGRVLASSSQPAVLTRLPALVEAHAGELEQAGRSAPIAVDEGGERWLVVLAPFVGEASAHRAAYALLVPRAGEPQVGALVGQLASTDPKSLPWMSLAPIGGGLFVAILVGLLLLRLESDRPLKRLAREAQALARGELQRLDDDRHPGKLGAVARAVNTTLDRIGAGGRAQAPRPSQPRFDSPRPSSPRLDSPRPTPAPRFDSPRPAPPPRLDSGRQDPPRARLDSPRPPPPRHDSSPRVPSPLSLGLPRDEPGPLLQSESTPVVDASQMALASIGDTDQQETGLHHSPPGPDFVDAPQLAPLPPTTTGGPAGVKSPRSFDDEPTVANPAAARALLGMMNDSDRHTAPQPKLSEEEEALEAELKQVYQDFIDTKQRCGEPIEGVGYEKFVVKLRSNRQQLISRYQCKTVRFQVYIKDGKAALKATPIS
jgi:hypothetical protein